MYIICIQATQWITKARERDGEKKREREREDHRPTLLDVSKNRYFFSFWAAKLTKKKKRRKPSPTTATIGRELQLTLPSWEPKSIAGGEGSTRRYKPAMAILVPIDFPFFLNYYWFSSIALFFSCRKEIIWSRELKDSLLGYWVFYCRDTHRRLYRETTEQII